MSDKTILAEGRFLRLVTRKTWEFVERPNTSGVVGIVAVTEDREIVLIEQYREPLQAICIEIPAGLVGDVPESADESMETAAIRELYEETGFRADHMEFLLRGPLSPGSNATLIHLFRAYGLTREGDGGGDETEEIVVHTVPLDSAKAWLTEREQEGMLVDPKVFTALYHC
jgi:ADP-ribose pyrophosphatase